MIKRFERRSAIVPQPAPFGNAPFSPLAYTLRYVPFWWRCRPLRPRFRRVAIMPPAAYVPPAALLPRIAFKPTPRPRLRAGLVVMPRDMPGNSPRSPQPRPAVLPSRPKLRRAVVIHPILPGVPTPTSLRGILVPPRFRRTPGRVIAPIRSPNVGVPFVSPRPIPVPRPRLRPGLVAGARHPLIEPIGSLLTPEPPVLPQRPRPRRGLVYMPRRIALGDLNRTAFAPVPPRLPRPKPRPGLVIRSRLVPILTAPARPLLMVPPRPKARPGRAIVPQILSLQPSRLPLPARLVNPARKLGRAVVRLARWFPATPGVPIRARITLSPRAARRGLVIVRRIPPSGVIAAQPSVYPDPDASTSSEA